MAEVKTHDQLKAAMAVSEVVFAEKTSRDEVISGLSQRMVGIYAETNPDQQKAMSDGLIAEVTAGHCVDAQQLVDESAVFSGYEYARRGLAEAIVMPIATMKFNIEGIEDPEAKDRVNAAYDTLLSGDVAQIADILPEGLKELAKDVAEVLVPEPIVDKVTELNQRLVSNVVDSPATRSRDAITINTAVEELVVDMTKMGKGSRDQVVTALIIDKFQQRANELGGSQVSGRQSRSEELQVLTELKDAVVGSASEFPADKEGQMRVARAYLDLLEANEWKPGGSVEAGPTMKALTDFRKVEAGRPPLDSEVRQEIETRIRIRFMKSVMSVTGGNLSDSKGGPTIPVAQKEAENMGMLFQESDLKWIFSNKTNKLSKSIQEAWDMYQQMNIEDGGTGYNWFLKNMMGDPDFCAAQGIDQWSQADRDDILRGGTNRVSQKSHKGAARLYYDDAKDNYFGDSNQDRKGLVRSYMEYKLMSRGYSDYEAKKAVVLAWDTVIATGEEAAFNKANISHGLSLAVHTLNTSRKTSDDLSPIGPETATRRMVQIGTTWLRSLGMATPDGKYQGGLTVNRKLLAKDINPIRMKSIKTNEQYFYGAVMAGAAEPYIGVINANVTPKDLTGDTILKTLGWADKLSKFPAVILDKDGKTMILEGDTVKVNNGEYTVVSNVDNKLRLVSGGASFEIDRRSAQYDSIKLIAVSEKGDKERAKRLRTIALAGWFTTMLLKPENGWTEGYYKSYMRPFLLAKHEISNEEANTVENRSYIEKQELNDLERTIFGFNYRKLKATEDHAKKLAGKVQELVPTYPISASDALVDI